MRKQKNRAVARRATEQRFADGIANSLLRVGQVPQNLNNASRYRAKFKTMDRAQLEWAYQTSWMCGLVVDIVAEDMTREGIDVKSDNPQIVDDINKQLDDLLVWSGICDALKWSRLYGGSIAVILIEGDDMSTPLREVRKDSFRGVAVFDRWQLDQSAQGAVQELGPNFGLPEFYRVIPTATDVHIPSDRIHHSRVIRFEGRRLPWNLRQAYMGWGASVLEPMFDCVSTFDTATSSASQLLSKAYLRFYKVKDLRDILTNDIAAKGFLKQMDYMRQFQSNEGLTIGDAEDDFQTIQYSFTGIPEIILQFGQQISGAIGVPLVRLFGQSPVGLNSTGESDLRIYYDNVKHEQDSDLRPGMKRLLNVMYQSITGHAPGPDFGFEFKPLWQMSTEQKAATAQAMVGSIIQSLDSGAISTATALKELKKLSDVIGMFASITDEDIESAEETDNAMMPPTAEEMDATEEGAKLPSVSRADENGTSGRLVQEAPEGNS